MPIRKKAIKSLRKSEKSRAENRRLLINLKKQIKNLSKLISEEKFEEAKSFLHKTLISKIDKATKKGILHKNTAARKKSKLTKKVTSAGKKKSE